MERIYLQLAPTTTATTTPSERKRCRWRRRQQHNIQRDNAVCFLGSESFSMRSQRVRTKTWLVFSSTQIDEWPSNTLTWVKHLNDENGETRRRQDCTATRLDYWNDQTEREDLVSDGIQTQLLKGKCSNAAWNFFHISADMIWGLVQIVKQRALIQFSQSVITTF